MFNSELFCSLSLTEKKSYKIIEYITLNLCGEEGVKWWNTWGDYVAPDEEMNGDPLHDMLTKVWWNLVTIDNYIDIDYFNASSELQKDAGGPYIMTQEEIDKNRKKYSLSIKIIQDIKNFINKIS